MLLSFKTSNYKSFKNEIEFSMIPAEKQKGLDYSILSDKIGRNVYKALCSAVIYGPNASGKTNIIGAMDTMRAIILRGNINNAESVDSPNISSYNLEFIPFSASDKAEPVIFEIKFIESGMVIEYSFSMIVGSFLERNFKRKIVREQLIINNKNIFIRFNDELGIFNIKSISKYLNDDIEKNILSAGLIAENGLSETELFLTNGFKTIFSKECSSVITAWFAEKLMTIYRADAVQTTKRYVNPKEDTIYVERTLNEAAKEFGINSNALGFKMGKPEDEAVLCSVFKREINDFAIPAEMFESYGTLRFVNLFPLIIYALLNGSTLVIDEFDASIHPMALMNIINIFHNDDINKKHAQLIFNTHNPIFLNSNLYRRDEIKFVERDEETHISSHYSLSDFKTYGENGVRKGEDYMKKYFINQYGAIKDVDFSSIFEDLMNSENGADEIE